MDYAFDDGDERCFRCRQDVSTCECSEAEVDAFIEGEYQWFLAEERRAHAERRYFAGFVGDEWEG